MCYSLVLCILSVYYHRCILGVSLVSMTSVLSDFLCEIQLKYLKSVFSLLLKWKPYFKNKLLVSRNRRRQRIEWCRQYDGISPHSMLGGNPGWQKSHTIRFWGKFFGVTMIFRGQKLCPRYFLLTFNLFSSLCFQVIVTL